MKNIFKSEEQVNNLREIQALRRLSPHPNIVALYEVILYFTFITNLIATYLLENWVLYLS